MGVYTYNCQNCGILNLELKMSQIPLDKCPECRCSNIQRIFQPTNSVWKVDGAFSKPNIKE